MIQKLKQQAQCSWDEKWVLWNIDEKKKFRSKEEILLILYQANPEFWWECEMYMETIVGKEEHF